MQYQKQELILDNFRCLLFEYSVDVQDIVRSSILDNIDIIPYLSTYKEDPYKLDQIRLALKEGLPKVFFKTSGSMLYQIRQMHRRGIDLTSIENQLKYNLSEQSMQYLIKWVDDGINISKLNLAIIPNHLLETFDYGLCSGFDMTEFNNGKSYSSKYVKLCLQIKKNDKPISVLLSGDWSIDNLNLLSVESRMQENKWNSLINNIDEGIDTKRLELVIKLVKIGAPIQRLQEKGTNGKYKYDNTCLELVHGACFSNLDLNVLLKTTSSEQMKVLKSQLELDKKRKISGKLVRN